MKTIHLIFLAAMIGLCSCGTKNRKVTYTVTPTTTTSNINAGPFVIRYTDTSSAGTKEVRLNRNPPPWTTEVLLPPGTWVSLTLSNESTTPQSFDIKILENGSVVAGASGALPSPAEMVARWQIK